MSGIDLDAITALHAKAVALPWVATDGGTWIYTARAMLRTNQDGTLTNHPYNGRMICISRGSGGDRRDRANNAFIVAWCNAFPDVAAELRRLRAAP